MDNNTSQPTNIESFGSKGGVSDTRTTINKKEQDIKDIKSINFSSVMILQSLKGLHKKNEKYREANNGQDMPKYKDTEETLRVAIKENEAKIAQLDPNFKPFVVYSNIDDKINEIEDEEHKFEEYSVMSKDGKKITKYYDKGGVEQSKRINDMVLSNTGNINPVQRLDKDVQISVENNMKQNESKQKEEPDYSSFANDLFSKLNLNRSQETTEKVKDTITEKKESENSKQSTEDYVSTKHNSSSVDVEEIRLNMMKQRPVTDVKTVNGIIPPYDVISLPSKGQCYGNKKDSIAVAYINASDEDMITSPNLYENNKIIEYLLNAKVIDKDFDNPKKLCKGDVDAITLWLRINSYGSDYPISVTDPDTNTPFDSVIDLSTIKYKPFDLVSDENGLFDFECPVSKAVLKFRFLSLYDQDTLDSKYEMDNNNIRHSVVVSSISRLKNAIKMEKDLSEKNKKALTESLGVVSKWSDDTAEIDKNPFLRTITDFYKLAIVAVDGNTDRTFVDNFVMNMPALDSLKFRKYMTDNEPGVDFSVEIEKPKNLGGGSLKTFLEWDKYVFTNIANV